MRDLIRDFKMFTKQRDEPSDAESQPLLSSQSSVSSFGATQNGGMFPDYDTTDCEECDKAVTKLKISPNSLPQIYTRRSLCVPRRSVYDTPALDVYTAEEEIYDRWPYFSKVSGVLPRPSSPQKSLSDSGYHDVDGSTTQSSLVTIFAIWNTTMGSSLLAMPWGIERAGLFPGIIINILVASICLYTCYILLKVNDGYGLLGQNNQVSDLCRMLIGRWAEVIAKIFSSVVLLGSNIVYWVLMSNFLYYSIYLMFGSLTSETETAKESITVICPKDAIFNTSGVNFTIVENQEISTFDSVWDLHRTAPVVLGIIMFPLLNFKSPTFFTKFNSLGTISAMFLLVFVATKAISWGINIPDWSAEFDLKSSFCVLSGMLSLSYFIHNIIITIMKNNSHQENNGRDLSIAFILVTFTYLFIGVITYISFPLPKFCIEDNILNNFKKHDQMTIIARALLLFQLLTVFPLISYMLRMEIFRNLNMFFKNCSEEFSCRKVIMVNICIVTVCILFACFFPKIGTLIRYTGALSGLVYIFLLPSLLKLASLRKEQTLTAPTFIFYVVIIVFGFINVIAQFFIDDKQ